MNSRLPVLFALLATMLQTCLGQSIAREPKYRTLTNFSIGRLSFTDVHVSLVAVKPSPDVDRFETVPILQLDKGHFSIKSITGESELLSGDIGEGSTSDPAALMNGRFHWNNRQIDSVEISDLKLRLKNVSAQAQIGGSKLGIPSTTPVFIRNRMPLSASEDISLDVVIPNSTLKKVTLIWKGVKFSVDLTSSENSTLRIGAPKTPEIQIVNARYTTKAGEAEVSEQISDLLPDLRVDSGLVKLQGLSVDFQNAKPILSAERLTIEHPELYVPSRQLKVAASAEVVGTKVSLLGDADTVTIRTGPDTVSVDKYTVAGNSDKIIEELNLRSRLRPDVLLPTNNPDARFIKASAAAAFYRGLARVPGDGKATNIRVVGHDGIVDFVDSNEFDVSVDFARKASKDSNMPKVICSVAVDLAVGNAAGSIALSLADLAFQARRAITLATLMNVSSKLSPEYGELAARSVAKTTMFLTNTKTGRMILKKAAGEIVTPGDLVCDVLLSTPVPDDSVRALYKPQIMQSLSNPPDNWDDVSVRYSALLDGVVRLRLSQAEMAAYKKLESDAKQRSTFVAEVIEQRAVLTSTEQQKAKAAQEQSKRDASIFYQRQRDDMNVNYALAQGPRQAAKAEQEKEAAEKKRQQDQLAQTPQPGTTSTTGGTGNGTGTTGDGKTQQPCPNGQVCLQTQPKVPNK